MADYKTFLRKISKVLTGAEGKEPSKLIKYDELGKLPIYTPIQFGDGISSVRLPFVGGLYFKTDLLPGAVIEEHYHDVYENHYIAEGVISDVINGKTYSVGENVGFNAGEVHKLATAGGCVIFSQLFKFET